MVVLSDRWNQGIQNPNFCRCGFLHLYSGEADDTKTRPVWVAIGLLAALFAVEFFVSLWSGSLALLADAGHMLVDVAVLGLTLTATYMAQRPASGRATFGYGRVEILVALINGLSLVAVAIIVGLEVAERLRSPVPVLGLPMLVGASLGLVVNSINVGLLYRNSRQNLNLRSAFLHVAADAASSVGLVGASLAIHLWHWLWIDAVISLLIAVLTSFAAIPLIKESVEIFLELSPDGIDPLQVQDAILAFDGVEQVETLHIWTIKSGEVALSAHIRVQSISTGQRDYLVKQLQASLSQQFGIHQSTLQLLEYGLPNAVFHPLLHRSLTDRVLSRT